jgi:hypothetical protein
MHGLSMPMPKADVATIRSASPDMKRCCASSRRRLPIPAW